MSWIVHTHRTRAVVGMYILLRLLGPVHSGPVAVVCCVFVHCKRGISIFLVLSGYRVLEARKTEPLFCGLITTTPSERLPGCVGLFYVRLPGTSAAAANFQLLPSQRWNFGLVFVLSLRVPPPRPELLSVTAAVFAA